MHNTTKPKAEPEALVTMQERGGQWAAYRNADLSSAGLGHIQFLKIGEDCTYQEPPKHYPADTQCGMGWRYLYLGMVDLNTGLIIEEGEEDEED